MTTCYLHARNSSLNYSFPRRVKVSNDSVGKLALLTPQSPIFSRRGLPASLQFRHARGFFCYDRFFLGARIDLNEHRRPSVCFCVPKWFKRSVAIAQENGLIVDS